MIFQSAEGSTNGRGTDIFLLNAQSSKNISHPSSNIAFASCDDDDYPGEISLTEVTSDAVDAKVSAVIFASKHQPYCNLTNAAPSGYTAYYSMTDVGNSKTLINELGGVMSDHMGMASIMTQVAYKDAMSKSADGGFGGPSPSTAVAMIILYSITGVITALFLVIIITGAIRAHRHPERYRPRVLGGQGRPSRAKGLARAMLDSIPIVKFGDNQQQKEPREGEGEGDIEMAEGASNSSRRRSGDQRSRSGSDAREHREDETEDSPRAARTSADGNTDGSAEDPTSTAATASAQPSKRNSKAPGAGAGAGSNAEEGLGCSICTEDFVKGEDIRVLPCDHKFHPACVDPWLLDVSGTCPLCRVDLRPRKSGEAGTQEEGAEEYLDTNTLAEPRRRSTLFRNGNNNALGAIGPGGANDREGAPLPPPLDGDGADAALMNTRHRRRDTIIKFFDPWRLSGMTREQRVAALRDYRQEQRRSGDNNTTARDGESNGEAGSSAAAQEMSGGSGPGAATARGVDTDETGTVDAHARRNRWSRVRRTMFMGAARDRRSTATTASAGAGVAGNEVPATSANANTNTNAVGQSSSAQPVETAAQAEALRELEGDGQDRDGQDRDGSAGGSRQSRRNSQGPSSRKDEKEPAAASDSPEKKKEEGEPASHTPEKKEDVASPVPSPEEPAVSKEHDKQNEDKDPQPDEKSHS